MRREPVEDAPSNWKAMPRGYHARSGTVTGPNADIRRPNGQYRSAGTVVTGASRALDFELEIGIILSRASALGERVAAEAFEQHVFGLTLLNDWSARDLQRRSEEHTSELQSLMRISYAVFCLQKKTTHHQ